MVAFSQTIDPVGFCPPGPSTNTTCFTGNGVGNETIGVGATTFVMEKNGSTAPSSDPWELILALPNYNGPAPTLSTSDFTLTALPVNAGHFLSTTAGSIYDFTGTTGDASMNAANMFGANEVAAFGSVPSFFDVFVYTYTPSFVGSFTPYTFTVGGSGLPAGTFLAASGGSQPFSTPFTTTGLVDGPGCTTTGNCGGGPGGNPVPEPTSVLLLGTAALFAGNTLRKRISLG